MSFEQHMIFLREINKDYHAYYESTLLAQQVIEKQKKLTMPASK